MLASLTIRNIVLIESLSLDFAPGLAVLTGETGAGKSILLDSLGLGLGARADARLVRHGADQASVTAAFDLSPAHPVFPFLADQGLAVGGEIEGLVVRRTLNGDGRSRAFVNDQPVSAGLLRQIGQYLVEIHGQFENQRLLDPASHRRLLDSFGGLEDELAACATAWRGWRQAVDALAAAEQALTRARAEEDFLRHAVDELAAMRPSPGEEVELSERRAFLMNAEKVSEAVSAAAVLLTGEGERGGVDSSLQGARRQLDRVADKVGGRLDAVLAAIDAALSQVIEAQAQLERTMADTDLDPRQLQVCEERLFGLRALARKHGVEVDGLAALLDDLRQRLDALDSGAAHIATLAAAEAEARADYIEATTHLSTRRAAAAERLDARMAAELQPLKLGKARFMTRVEPLAETAWNTNGADKVAFEVSTNPGMPPGPLAKIASGGELARFTLALKVVLAEADPVPTLVFDEVDAGVGGAVAAAVGERLARLAGTCQVLVVTHSPQVAARGHHQLRISKDADGETARTRVHVLSEAERREEIARMLAGATVTDEARAAAESLLIGASG